jgi:hypothetical protein
MPGGVAAAVALAFAVAPFVELPFSGRAKLRASAAEPGASPSMRRVPARGLYDERGVVEEVADERQAA